MKDRDKLMYQNHFDWYTKQLENLKKYDKDMEASKKDQVLVG